jgi:hypothetical protein
MIAQDRHNSRMDGSSLSSVRAGTGKWGVHRKSKSEDRELSFADTNNSRPFLRKMFRRAQSCRNPQTQRELMIEARKQKVHLLIHDAELWCEFKADIKAKGVVTNVGIQQHMFQFVEQRMPPHPVGTRRIESVRLIEDQSMSNYSDVPRSLASRLFVAPRVQGPSSFVAQTHRISSQNMLDPANYSPPSATNTSRSFFGMTSATGGASTWSKPSSFRITQMLHNSSSAGSGQRSGIQSQNEARSGHPSSDLRALGTGNIRLNARTPKQA